MNGDMIKLVFLVNIICLTQFSLIRGNTPNSGPIGKAVEKCEAAVAKNCVDSGICAKFCDAAYSRSKSGKTRCLNEIFSKREISYR